MFSKTKIALSAIAILGSASAVFATEVPENRIGDRYPFLEGKQVAAKSASMIVAYEIPESLADRYPAPLHIAAPVRSKNAGRKMTNVRQATTAIEVPENRIGDRYPFLASKQTAKNKV